MKSSQTPLINIDAISTLAQEGDENPLYPRQDWLLEYSNGDTALPYWDWVEMVREQGIRSVPNARR